MTPSPDQVVASSSADASIAATPANADPHTPAMLEAALREARQEAEAARRAKDEFLACMSHELRTPLNAIIGFSDGLINRIAKHPLNEHQRSRVLKIREAGHHLLALINDVLDVARIEAGEVRPNVSQMNVNDLLTEVAELAKALGRDKPAVRFELDVQAGLPPLHSDRQKIRETLFHLLSNAFKFTDSGSVTLAARLVQPFIRITVQDSGMGIREDRLHTIFEKFQQVDGSARRTRGGTGLGLTICQRFAELIGGHLTVRSVEGQGATFALSVPLQFVEDARKDAQQLISEVRCQCDQPATDAALRVLCIDDNALNMRMVQHYIQKAGYGFIAAFTGAEGLDLAVRERPDAVLLDVMMPDMDGWKVLRRLKDDPVTRDIPVLMTTAVDNPDRGADMGAHGYLLKPVRSRDLIEQLQRIQQRKGVHVP